MPQIIEWKILKTGNNRSTSEVQLKLLIHSKKTSEWICLFKISHRTKFQIPKHSKFLGSVHQQWTPSLDSTVSQFNLHPIPEICFFFHIQFYEKLANPPIFRQSNRKTSLCIPSWINNTWLRVKSWPVQATKSCACHNKPNTWLG
jgi:hypothetical protein